jgi:dCMP deaminase
MNKWHKSFLKIAQEFASHSTCIRKQVGCILVRDSRIISTGYNGTSSGMQHCNEVFKEHKDDLQNPKFLELHKQWSEKHELHAEQNCLMYAAKNGVSTNNGVLYLTLSPCIHCCKLIISAGIKEVYYSEEYDRETEGLELLKGANISCNFVIL